MQAFIDYICSLREDVDIPQWSGYMPEKKLGAKLQFFDLHPVMRALMIADGTVTMAIEAIYREPVIVALQQQEALKLEQTVPLLNVAANKELFFRHVELRGKLSEKTYVSAYSLLKREALDDQLWTKLKNKEVGMGVVLRNAAQGSFRKVLHMGAGDLRGEGEKSVHRTYSVHINDRPSIAITEVFNLDAFSDGY